jgi:nitrate/nitrite transport system ATP-binding protein
MSFALSSPTKPESIRAVPREVQLSIQGVTKGFPGSKVRALAEIDLDIKRGEFVSFIGHSGCGKSTLLNLIAGLYPPSSGALFLDGEKIERPGPDRAMVFQNYSLLPWLSVWDNVFEALDGSIKNKSELVEEVVRKVGLWAHKDKKPGQISGGMKQRVAIARALAVRPKVLLLDEPFGALDALTKSSLHDELMMLWTGESAIETVLMVTHDIDEAIYLSDRIVVMTNGPEARVGEILEVPLPRPRDKRALLHSPEWATLKEELLQLLTVKYGHPASESK